MGKAMRILAVAAVACLACLLLSACGTTMSPTDTTKAFLDAMKASDTEKISQYYSGDASAFGTDSLEQELGSSSSAGNLSEEDKQNLKTISEKIMDFDYSVGNEKIDGDSATVDVTLKTYDFGTALTDAVNNVYTSVLSEAFNGKTPSSEKIASKVYKEFAKQIGKHKEKSETTTVTMKLAKEDGSWKVSEVDEDFLDALTGKMISSMGALDASASTSSSSAAA